MMSVVVLKKRYTITVEIHEGNDEFWESFHGRSGCDEVVAEVKRCLCESGFIHLYVALEKFDHGIPSLPDQSQTLSSGHHK